MMRLTKIGEEIWKLGSKIAKTETKGFRASPQFAGNRPKSHPNVPKRVPRLPLWDKPATSRSIIVSYAPIRRIHDQGGVHVPNSSPGAVGVSRGPGKRYTGLETTECCLYSCGWF